MTDLCKTSASAFKIHAQKNLLNLYKIYKVLFLTFSKMSNKTFCWSKEVSKNNKWFWAQKS